MKGILSELKDFSPKLKVSEILLCLKPQNRQKNTLSYAPSRRTLYNVVYVYIQGNSCSKTQEELSYLRYWWFGELASKITKKEAG